jgi:hypothetical protein
MATFFDLFEDGKLDVLAVEGSSGTGYKLSAYTNTTQDSDAYFIKVSSGSTRLARVAAHLVKSGSFGKISLNSLSVRSLNGESLSHRFLFSVER